MLLVETMLKLRSFVWVGIDEGSNRILKGGWMEEMPSLEDDDRGLEVVVLLRYTRLP